MFEFYIFLHLYLRIFSLKRQDFIPIFATVLMAELILLYHVTLNFQT